MRLNDSPPSSSEPDDAEDWRQSGIGGLFGPPSYHEQDYDESDDGEPDYGDLDYVPGPEEALAAIDPADPSTGVRRWNVLPEWRLPAALAARGTRVRTGAPAGGYAEARHRGMPADADAADALSSSLLLPSRRRAPSAGWRRAIYQASGGVISVPLSASDLRKRDMISRARTPVASGHHRVAVISIKGGVGKTTTVVGLGSTLASLRGDRVIAIDANPERGTLSDRLTPQTSATVRDLLNARTEVHRYSEVQQFTSQTSSKLEVLASEQNPAASVGFSEADYYAACAVLERYYSICITDCAGGLMHSAMAGVLRLADQIVLVSTASVDGARSASACLDWLAAHGHEDLVGNGVVVLTGVGRRAGRTGVYLDRLEEHFTARCRAVTRVPYDPYLAQGAEAELDQMRRGTATAFLELAALVGDGFSRPRTQLPANAPTAG